MYCSYTEALLPLIYPEIPQILDLLQCLFLDLVQMRETRNECVAAALLHLYYKCSTLVVKPDRWRILYTLYFIEASFLLIRPE